MIDFFRKTVLASIGALSLSEERARAIIEELAAQGKISREEGEQLVAEILEKADASRKELEGRVSTLVGDGLKKLDLVTRSDFEKLESYTAKLEKRVAQLEKWEREREEEVPFSE